MSKIMQTHYEGCWRDRRHHACAMAEIERLRADNARLRAALGQQNYGLRARAEVAEADYDVLRVERDALHATLRKVAVVGYELGVGTWCRVCHQWWLSAAPEAHAPDCLAAPKGGER